MKKVCFGLTLKILGAIFRQFLPFLLLVSAEGTISMLPKDLGCHCTSSFKVFRGFRD
jgi:hypothetical protein